MNKTQLIKQLEELKRDFFDQESTLLNSMGTTDHYGTVSRKIARNREIQEILSEAIKFIAFRLACGCYEE